jgi:PAS domain-containing protein
MEVMWTVCPHSEMLEDIIGPYDCSIVPDQYGTPAGVFLICEQNIEKLQLVRELKLKNDELVFAIEACELATFDYHPDTSRVIGNERLLEWFGLPPHSEFDIAFATNAIAAHDRSAVLRAIRAALQPDSGGRFDIQYTIIHPQTNAERFVHAKGIVWFDKDNEPYRFNGTLADITKDTVYKKELSFKEESLRLAIDIGRLGLYHADLLHETITFSKFSTDWFGLSSDTIRLIDLYSWIEPAQQPAILAILQDTFRGKNEGRHDIVARIHLPGETGQYIRSIGQVLWDNDIPVALSGIIQEISEAQYALHIETSNDKSPHLT